MRENENLCINVARDLTQGVSFTFSGVPCALKHEFAVLPVRPSLLCEDDLAQDLTIVRRGMYWRSSGLGYQSNSSSANACQPPTSPTTAKGSQMPDLHRRRFALSSPLVPDWCCGGTEPESQFPAGWQTATQSTQLQHTEYIERVRSAVLWYS